MAIVLAAGASATAAPALSADRARITGLAPVNFGLLTGTADRTVSQNVCAYTSSSTSRYSVTATGSGNGGSFELTSASTALSYEVLWSDAPGQSGGIGLVAGSPANGFQSTATQHFCNSGPSASASLTILIRALAIGSARAGSYAGTLQLTIAPE